MSHKMAITAEPIAGYTLTEQIGAGGYGEVWKAEAPGGLTKAVKLVFGQMQDHWAACELRSLRRIKEVRHPFLLSIERIEIVEGQLVIVTELADGSLKDRSEECRRSGLPGIPRDELLGHLSDAAEALDYMREKFSLQHLDVKPENLLMVGGRVKIGDFGLVRDIMDPQWSRESMAKSCGDGGAETGGEGAAPAPGGLTPRYASPELFDGQPSVHSDQYSLAIVYQELLTGVLPYPGETTEQLATQHRNGSPRLAPLPPADRPAIARALAKEPGKRFASCRELIAALRSPAQAASRQLPDGEISHPSPQGHADTAGPGFFDIPTEAGVTQPRAVTMDLGAEPAVADMDLIPEPLPVIELPPLEISGRDQLRPTLWLGIGGTAAVILRRLRQRLHSRFGNLSEFPAMQMLLVDTDRETISQARQGDETLALGEDETLLTPLRKAQEYRERSGEYLRWLSRRWLYNIPYSGRTEGFRPLGRLAFVDHGNEIVRKLHDVLKSITAPENLAATSQATGMEFRDQLPRVFLIASISGGTGGGMALDMAYAVQKALDHLGLPAHCLCGMLTHSTTRVPERKTLAIADAYAWLREWKYWQTNKDRREAACWPSSGDDNPPPLSQAYLVHLGDDIGEAEFERATDDVAAYLDLDVATAGGEFFDKCRLSPNAAETPQKLEVRLRTLGIFRKDSSNEKSSNATFQQRLDRMRFGVSHSGPATLGSGRELDATKLRHWAMSHTEVADLLAPDPNSEHGNSLIAGYLDLASPRLLACGGSRRFLLAVPEGSTTSETQQSLASCLGFTPMMISRQSNELVFCCEAECLDVDRVAVLLAGQRRDCIRMAVRLHTRIDVPWTGQHGAY